METRKNVVKVASSVSDTGEVMNELWMRKESVLMKQLSSINR